jgi:penicillin-binding protein 1A
MVGGYHRQPGGLNRATQSLRQPGSVFKPILYATALKEKIITPASICPDAPVVIRDKWTGKAWKPENYEDGRYDGNITYRRALTRSKNTCSVKLIEMVGVEKVRELARNMGIGSRLPENLTLALGTGEVTPMELANSYATIASGGFYAKPIFIRKVVSLTGDILQENRANPTQVLDADVAFVITHMMQSVIEEGTGVRAKRLKRALAGKTGTTNQNRNAWFAGFSPGTVAVTWVGFDDNAPMGRATGSSAALPIWVDYLDHALKDTPKLPFKPPPEVVFRRVDADTGTINNDIGSIEEVFVAGTAPEESAQELESIFIDDEDGLDAQLQ